MKVTINKAYKSIPAGFQFELPAFSVLTGRNGSGKSHLLEAMANTENSTILLPDQSPAKRLLIGFGGLNPQIDEACDPQQISQNAKNWWNQIFIIQNNLRNARANGESISGAPEALIAHWGHNPQLVAVVNTITKKLSKTLEELQEDDVYFNMSIADANAGSIFSSQLALIFKTYHVRYTKNEFKQFLNRTKGANHQVLSEEQFSKRYGPKPWVLVNEILNKAGLAYEVANPEAIDTESTYKLRLIDRSNGTDISANDLSTGEKVLMSLAVAIYNTQDSAGKPDILMLDEPDAPLHPQYSKLLINTLREVVVEKAGVQVVISTHSPSTVAMCPDNSLFEMNKATKTIQMISVSQGLEILTEGIPHLKVSIEERRQIFVESKYDVLYFQKLSQIVGRHSRLSYQPIFLEPHSGTSNCSDVESIVGRLHEAGSDLVRGIIDWDGQKVTKHPIYVLGDGRRYSIENYILDPLFIGLALIRSAKKSFSDFSINNLHSYVDAARITNEDAQRICDWVLTTAEIKPENTKPCTIQNGWNLDLPHAFLSMRGHDWEKNILAKIPELHAISSKSGDAGLKLGVLQVIEEFPQFISTDIAETLLAVH